MSVPAIPPHWAESALRALLPSDRVDHMTGDLLEAFRDEPRASGSALFGNIWYGRQVATIFLRAYWPFPAMLTAIFLLNDLSNTFLAHGGRGPDLFGPALALVLLSAAFIGGWRTRLVRGGVAAAVGTHVVAWAGMTLWWTLTTYPFALTQQTQPYWIEAWHSSARPDESFMHWIVWDNVGAVLLGGSMLLLLSVVLGLVGGAAGKQIMRRQTAI